MVKWRRGHNHPQSLQEPKPKFIGGKRLTERLKETEVKVNLKSWRRKRMMKCLMKILVCLNGHQIWTLETRQERVCFWGRGMDTRYGNQRGNVRSCTTWSRTSWINAPCQKRPKSRNQNRNRFLWRRKACGKDSRGLSSGSMLPNWSSRSKMKHWSTRISNLHNTKSIFRCGMLQSVSLRTSGDRSLIMVYTSPTSSHCTLNSRVAPNKRRMLTHQNQPAQDQYLLP